MCDSEVQVKHLADSVDIFAGLQSNASVGVQLSVQNVFCCSQHAEIVCICGVENTVVEDLSFQNPAFIELSAPGWNELDSSTTFFQKASGHGVQPLVEQSIPSIESTLALAVVANVP